MTSASPWRRRAKFVGLGLAALVGVLLTRAALLSPEAFDPGQAPSVPEVNADEVAQRLSRAVAIPTVSPDGSPERDEAMRALHRQFEQDFPLVHQTLKRETVNELSLIFRWPGTDASAGAVLLIGHMDVVPVEPGTEDNWGQPPFSGAIVDGLIWGRGTLDDKTGSVGLLQAAELLLASGFKPRRTLVIALGHDEEVGGRKGARSIAQLFEDRGEHFDFLLDEGGVIVEGGIPGLERPAALVGIAEKGYATVEVSLKDEGGHASMPPDTGAIQRLAAAISRVQDEPMPREIRGATAAMLDHMAPHMSFGTRIGLANRWLLDPVLATVMTLKPPTHASVRTTLVPTMLEAGVAPNVLASRAAVTFNSRILPGDTVDDVLEHLREVIDDEQVEVRCTDDCWDPSAVSDIDSRGFDVIHRSIAHVFPEAVTLPNLVIGATDARHYARVADNAFRFLPVRLGLEDTVRIHGTDERNSVAGFADAVRFYMTVMSLAAE